MAERNNDEWIAELTQPGLERDAALDDLRALLVRGLGYAMAKYKNVTEADVQDFAQDALLKILGAIGTFRGESRFTTWAHKIAVHVAFTELRRRRWRDVSLDEMIMTPDGDFIPKTWVDPSAKTEQQTIQRDIIEIMRQVIAKELTERQRQALVAVRIHGVPLAEVADRMGTNRNALYKLLFDARKRLQTRMLAKGLSKEDILAAFST